MKLITAAMLATLLALASTSLIYPNALGVVEDTARLISGIDSGGRALQEASVDELNRSRLDQGLRPLHLDPELRMSLESYLASSREAEAVELDALLAHLQETYPNLTAVSATLLWESRFKHLTSSLAKWDDGVDPQYSAFSVVEFRQDSSRGCIGLLSHRLPTFDLELANRTGGLYHKACVHCGKGHAVTLEKHSQTLQLRCPHCIKPYDILAWDGEGSYRHANAFMTGFDLPSEWSGVTGEATLRETWLQVTRRCRYQADDPYDAGAEAWQMPADTWHEAAGDCEDTALLLADALISRGYEARVALGKNWENNDHAWCVVKLEEKQYLLETTLDPETPPALVPVREAAKHYRPEQLFDRTHFYFPRREGVSHDYWGEHLWISVESPAQPDNIAQDRPHEAPRVAKGS